MTVIEKAGIAIKALDDKKGNDISAYKTDGITNPDIRFVLDIYNLHNVLSLELY